MKSHDRVCLRLFEEKKLTYHQIMSELGLSYDEVKHSLTRARQEAGYSSAYGNTEDLLDLEGGFLKLLKRGASKEELSNCFAVSEDKVDEVLDRLRLEGIEITTVNGINNSDILILSKEAVPNDEVHLHSSKSWKGDTVRFGVVSDTHLCSKYCRLDYLDKFYDILEQEEIDTVYHAGDILDGEGCYSGHRYELSIIGSDAQVEYTAEKYPKRDGIVTKFITGNHDLTYFKQQGRDIGKAISAERPDLEYLGQLGAYVKFSEKCDERSLMYVLHPDGGMPYAISYRPQIIARGFTEESKPGLMITGHLHQVEYLLDRGIHIIQPGAFQDQTPYTKRKGIFPKLGGWIIEVGFIDKKISSIGFQFKAF